MGGSKTGEQQQTEQGTLLEMGKGTAEVEKEKQEKAKEQQNTRHEERTHK